MEAPSPCLSCQVGYKGRKNVQKVSLPINKVKTDRVCASMRRKAGQQEKNCLAGQMQRLEAAGVISGKMKKKE